MNGLVSEHLSDGRNCICVGTACTFRSDIPAIPVIMYLHKQLKAEGVVEIPKAATHSTAMHAESG